MGLDTILARIRVQASARAIRVTDHAREEMEEEAITLAEVFEAISVGQIIEHYPDREESQMRCSIADCPGEYEQREVVRAVRQGERIIVIEHIPAEVCDVCGDVLFTPETIERLEALRQVSPPPTRTVPLYKFAESA